MAISEALFQNIKFDGRDTAPVCHAKLLGVTISQDLTWNKYVENIVKKAGKRVYMVYQLKREWITLKDLVTVYVSVVRSVLEYACPVRHINLSRYLSDNIHIIQKRALTCIFPGLGSAEILRRVNLDTLKVRRDSLCQTYFCIIKVGTHRLNHLLPDKRHTKYNISQEHVYPLPVTRTNRFCNSFIPWGLYNCQQARLGSARLGSARLGSARLGSARLGSARLGSARLGSARLGSARLGSARLGSARHGTARHGTARHGTARHGTARHGTARHGTARHGTARHGTARHGTARHGTARHGTCIDIL
ncbi:hypothetical protein NP493_781g01004 [Ridgeia piscesae]|uniref:Uncharacterized protein n=1 Tax=Ridgeia piscesae TaxID=27915 RepID=A0AAD9KPX1_RIDPI|nr:hypothetical protein NP493_781g01004 [Ridgeia piscesae]